MAYYKTLWQREYDNGKTYKEVRFAHYEKEPEIGTREKSANSTKTLLKVKLAGK